MANIQCTDCGKVFETVEDYLKHSQKHEEELFEELKHQVKK